MRYEMKARAFGVVRGAALHTPLEKYVFHRYDYQFTPPQLCFLCECLERTRDVEGSVVEVGCAFGATTVFLAKYLAAAGIDKPYVCIDTFSGFTAPDVDYERRHRGKDASFAAFRVNKREWFERTLERNGVAAAVHRADANTFDYARLGPVSFCLIDVDLYRPTLAALEGIVPNLAPGGIAVTDDCVEPYVFDGAHQAYVETAARMGVEPEVVHGSLGVVRG